MVKDRDEGPAAAGALAHVELAGMELRGASFMAKDRERNLAAAGATADFGASELSGKLRLPKLWERSLAAAVAAAGAELKAGAGAAVGLVAGGAPVGLSWPSKGSPNHPLKPPASLVRTGILAELPKPCM